MSILTGEIILYDSNLKSKHIVIVESISYWLNFDFLPSQKQPKNMIIQELNGFRWLSKTNGLLYK